MSKDSEPLALSIVIPAKDEAASIGAVVGKARAEYPQAEIIVVDDGSSDRTGEVAERAGATMVLRHPTCLGNGAAVKTGARAARGEILALLDGDGQHDPGELGRLLAKLDEGYHMAVGARSPGSHANFGRLFANGIYNEIASRLSHQRILDLTSGFRVVRASEFKQFLYMLPNGFSYPTTITMAFLRAGFSVCFEPIEAADREGKSHIRPIRDGVRFLVIIFKIATLYSPLKIFLPVSGIFFLTGVSYYAYTYFMFGRLTNMSVLIFSAAVIIFLIGLISEQITTLTFSRS